MKNINKKSTNIKYCLKILSILAFSLLIIPAVASADNLIYSGAPINQAPQTNNTWQIINSINPSSANRGFGAETVTISGDGFQPSSIARVNGSDRSTNFIDNSHLLVRLNANDTNRTDGGFYITVFNGAIGNGSYSNSAFFTVNVNTSAYNTTNNNNNSTNNNYNNSNTNQTENTTNDSASNIASNAIFGSNSLLPSGLIQWILLAILIIIIVILIRKISGGKERYDETPMKHE